MNLELIVTGSFMIAVILQSILLLKDFFTTKENFTVLLFSYLTSSFIYLSALLIFIANFYDKNELELIKVNNIYSLTSIKVVLAIIIITLVTTLFTIIISFIKNKVASKNRSSKYINQDQAKKLD